jgi:hypothetical protein
VAILNRTSQSFTGEVIVNKQKNLFDLKEWLTINEAAKHLSNLFDQEVGEADVLRLGLDGHLKLSVYFPNHAYARYGKVISTENETAVDFLKMYQKIAFTISTKDPICKKLNRPVNIRYEELDLDIEGSKKFLDDLFQKDVEFWPKGKRSPVIGVIYLEGKGGTNPNNSRYVILKNDFKKIKGVWDLAMVGSEAHYIEHMYQQLTGGPEITLICLEGAFIEGPNGVMCQLQESYDDCEYQSGSKKQLEDIGEYILAYSLKKEEADKLIAKHAENREKFLAEIADKERSEYCYPGSLPEDSVLVVRTQALIDLQNQIFGQKNDPKNELSPNAEKSYLHIIGALLSCLTGDFKNKSFGSEAKLRDFLDEMYDGIYGMSSRNLAAKFSEAKKALNDESGTLK